MREVLSQAEARLLECPTEPVHVYDLHETAMKMQQDIVEKEAEVRCAASLLPQSALEKGGAIFN